MKFRKMIEDVELPEKANKDLYINVRSAQRVDVRGNERINVRTGVEVLTSAKEVIKISGPNVTTTQLRTGNRYMEIVVPVYNNGPRNIMIYPGQVIASITVEREGEPPTKTATITSTATFTPASNDSPGFHRKEGCKGCGH